MLEHRLFAARGSQTASRSHKACQVLQTYVFIGFMQVLQEGASDQQLLLPLAVVMSQHLDWALYALSTKHLKEIAELHDRVNEITQQYLMVLEHCMAKDKALSLEEYARTLPPPHALIAEYGVHPGIAWMLWRPVVVALEPQLMAKLEVRLLWCMFGVQWGAVVCARAGDTHAESCCHCCFSWGQCWGFNSVQAGVAWMLWRAVVAVLEPQLMAKLEVVLRYICEFPYLLIV